MPDFRQSWKVLKQTRVFGVNSTSRGACKAGCGMLVVLAIVGDKVAVASQGE
jgi:hypothetical protein